MHTLPNLDGIDDRFRRRVRQEWTPGLENIDGKNSSTGVNYTQDTVYLSTDYFHLVQVGYICTFLFDVSY